MLLRLLVLDLRPWLEPGTGELFLDLCGVRLVGLACLELVLEERADLSRESGFRNTSSSSSSPSRLVPVLECLAELLLALAPKPPCGISLLPKGWLPSASKLPLGVDALFGMSMPPKG